jgi:hypothetical protein
MIQSPIDAVSTREFVTTSGQCRILAARVLGALPALCCVDFGIKRYCLDQLSQPSKVYHEEGRRTLPCRHPVAFSDDEEDGITSSETSSLTNSTPANEATLMKFGIRFFRKSFIVRY